MQFDWSVFTVSDEFLLKLAVAVIAAIIMGIDREIKMKGIGVKTITVIFLASTMLTHVALEVAYEHTAVQMRVVDPTRIPAYILSSLGFLGAGVILHKTNNVIAGLTTAAMVWASAGIGILIGYGYYSESLLLAVVIVLLVNLLPSVLRYFGPRSLRMRKMRITLKFTGEARDVIEHLKAYGLVLGNIRVKDSEKNPGTHNLIVTALIHESKYVTDVYDYIYQREAVTYLDIEGL